MPFYSVVIHGDGIRVPVEGEGVPVGGFYAARVVLAESREQALERARKMISDEWAEGPYALANQGSMPRLRIESASNVSFWRWLWFKNKGYTFYPEGT